MEKQSTENTKSPSQLIDERIEELGDWRGQMLSKLRSLIRQVDPEVVEEWKWRGPLAYFQLKPGWERQEGHRLPRGRRGGRRGA
jgi:hypothetical protein